MVNVLQIKTTIALFVALCSLVGSVSADQLLNQPATIKSLYPGVVILPSASKIKNLERNFLKKNTCERVKFGRDGLLNYASCDFVRAINTDDTKDSVLRSVIAWLKQNKNIIGDTDQLNSVGAFVTIDSHHTDLSVSSKLYRIFTIRFGPLTIHNVPINGTRIDIKVYERNARVRVGMKWLSTSDLQLSQKPFLTATQATTTLIGKNITGGLPSAKYTITMNMLSNPHQAPALSIFIKGNDSERTFYLTWAIFVGGTRWIAFVDAMTGDMVWYDEHWHY